MKMMKFHLHLTPQWNKQERREEKKVEVEDWNLFSYFAHGNIMNDWLYMEQIENVFPR